MRPCLCSWPVPAGLRSRRVSFLPSSRSLLPDAVSGPRAGLRPAQGPTGCESLCSSPGKPAPLKGLSRQDKNHMTDQFPWECIPMSPRRLLLLLRAVPTGRSSTATHVVGQRLNLG